jgi:hypothetical protein
MSSSPIPSPSAAGRSSDFSSHSIGVTPDFHHVPPTSAVAIESYIHLYLESSALTESTLKSSIERH